MTGPIAPGPRVRAARKAANLTQATVAARMGVSPQRYAAIEQDAKATTLETLLAVASAIGCRPNDLDERLA